MADSEEKRPSAAGANRGERAVRRTAAQGATTHSATMANTDVGQRRGMRRIARQLTVEDRLEAKAARGDRRKHTGPSLDEMSREERHKLLYGE
ncbi:MAG: hypothetical protein JOY65_05755 [Acetobacteraceae bacterium]|nr:hypothetical protein [Acetobacteraceae bacterium]